MIHNAAIIHLELEVKTEIDEAMILMRVIRGMARCMGRYGQFAYPGGHPDTGSGHGERASDVKVFHIFHV